MMYQRAAIVSLSIAPRSLGASGPSSLNARASDLGEQPAHRGAEDRIDAEEEHREDGHHDGDEDRGARGLGPSRPDHLACFRLDLVEELRRAGLGHCARASRIELATIDFRHRTIAAPA